jgi:hypothetical protein
VIAASCAVVTAAAFVGCLVELFADPLGVPADLLPVLDQRASVIGAIASAAGLAVAVVSLLVQLRSSRTGPSSPPPQSPPPQSPPSQSPQSQSPPPQSPPSQSPPSQSSPPSRPVSEPAQRTYLGDHIEIGGNVIHGSVIGKSVGGPRDR